MQSDTGNSIRYFSRHELLYSILLFGSVGAIAWAIRGTAGWGGVDGTVVPGLMWGILWYYLSYRKGIDARGVVFWLGLSLAMGGELGYGQYVSWIQGVFYVGDGTMSVDPGLGYLWFFICGVGWAAPGAIVLGWVLGRRASTKQWVVRIVLFSLLLIILFAWPVIEVTGEWLAKNFPSFLFPNADVGLYSSELGHHLSRTVYTNTQNFLVLLWWIAALKVAFWQHDKITLITGGIIGAGFGLGFMQSALWTLGYVSHPDFIDWWKMWELNAGFNLGLFYAVTFYVLLKKGYLTNRYGEEIEDQFRSEHQKTVLMAFAGFLLIFLTGFEYFLWTGLSMSLFYFVSMLLTTRNVKDVSGLIARRKNISFIFSLLFLLFILFFGGSERLGIFLDLYSLDEVSQYSWPVGRLLLFIPVAVVIAGITLIKIWMVIPSDSRDIISLSYYKISELITILGFVGVLSIWPSKIGVFYAFFIVIAIYAINRLEYKVNFR